MGATTSPRPAERFAPLLTLADLLAAHGLTGVPEEQMQHDGWSGAAMTRLTRGDGARFVLKRDSLARDWIARVTGDVPELREALLVRVRPAMPEPVTLTHLGVAGDGGDTVLLMPDLADILIRWEQPIDVATLDRVLAALAALHRDPWHARLPAGFPWTDRPRRLLLLTRPAAASYVAQGLPFGSRFVAGWDAFDRHVEPATRALIARLTADPEPLFAALGRLPDAGLHGDLKLGNVGLAADGSVPMIDWQMTMVAPIAVELGWFLVANVAGLPLPPDEVLERYRVAAALPQDGVWQAQRDLAVILGTFLRGWRKGLDADAGAGLPSGLTAAEDLSWWATNSVEAAERQLR
jgi:hypothetical protein